jgi:hypothetical protein
MNILIILLFKYDSIVIIKRTDVYGTVPNVLQFVWVEGGRYLVWCIVFKATFSNISLISWRSVLLVEDTRVPRENHRPAPSH